MLYKAYRNERDACVRERLLLVIRVPFDKQHIESVAKELHRAKLWAYKRYKRHRDEGWKIRDRQINGEPSAIPKGEMDKIKQELSDSNIEWGFREVVNLVQKRTRVRHHEVHICRLLHKWGFKSKVRRNGLSEEHPGKRKTSLKKHREY